MPEYVRVTDKDTGTKHSIQPSQLPHGNYTVLKADAVGPDGEPLPPEFGAVTPAGASTSSTDSKEK